MCLVQTYDINQFILLLARLNIFPQNVEKDQHKKCNAVNKVFIFACVRYRQQQHPGCRVRWSLQFSRVCSIHRIMKEITDIQWVSSTFALCWLWNRRLVKCSPKHNPAIVFFLTPPFVSHRPAQIIFHYLYFSRRLTFGSLCLTSVVHHHYSVWLLNKSPQQEKPFARIRLTCCSVVFTQSKKDNNKKKKHLLNLTAAIQPVTAK